VHLTETPIASLSWVCDTKNGTQYLIFNQFPSDYNFHPKSANISDQSKETCGVLSLISKNFLISRAIYPVGKVSWVNLMCAIII
jgi:hypothetical protein